MNIALLTDAALLLLTSTARGNAHRADFAEWSKDHRGHSSIVNHTNGWAVHGNEFLNLVGECERRGLSLPACDCPPGSHDWEMSTKKIDDKIHDHGFDPPLTT